MRRVISEVPVPRAASPRSARSATQRGRTHSLNPSMAMGTVRVPRSVLRAGARLRFTEAIRGRIGPPVYRVSDRSRVTGIAIEARRIERPERVLRYGPEVCESSRTAVVVAPLTRLRQAGGKVDELRTHLSIEIVDKNEVLLVPLVDVQGALRLGAVVPCAAWHVVH